MAAIRGAWPLLLGPPPPLLLLAAPPPPPPPRGSCTAPAAVCTAGRCLTLEKPVGPEAEGVRLTPPQKSPPMGVHEDLSVLPPPCRSLPGLLGAPAPAPAPGMKPSPNCWYCCLHAGEPAAASRDCLPAGGPSSRPDPDSRGNLRESTQHREGERGKAWVTRLLGAQTLQDAKGDGP